MTRRTVGAVLTIPDPFKGLRSACEKLRLAVEEKGWAEHYAWIKVHPGTLEWEIGVADTIRAVPPGASEDFDHLQLLNHHRLNGTPGGTRLAYMKRRLDPTEASRP